MNNMDRLRRPMVRGHATIWIGIADLKGAMRKRMEWRDEQGDVAARTVGIAVMAALAIAIGGIITTKVTNKANDIDLNVGPLSAPLY